LALPVNQEATYLLVAPVSVFDRRQGAHSGQVRAPILPYFAKWEPNQLFGLAGGGVYPAGTVTGAAVRSYRTISPLPVPRQVGAIGCVFSVALSLGSPPVAINHHRCPILLGLSSPAVWLRKIEAAGATAQPTLFN